MVLTTIQKIRLVCFNASPFKNSPCAGAYYKSIFNFLKKLLVFELTYFAKVFYWCCVSPKAQTGKKGVKPYQFDIFVAIPPASLPQISKNIYI